MARVLRIYLSDLSYSNRLNLHTRHVPKGIGMIASYAKKVFGKSIDVTLFNEAQSLLEAVNDRPPDILGQSFYFWNTNLNKTVARIIRQRHGEKVLIVWGGPSVDSDKDELNRLFYRFADVNAFIPNEGELGFIAVIGRLLSKENEPWSEPMDGVVHRYQGEVLTGRDVGLSLDLAEVPSPYLSGVLDPFLHTDLLPGIQTSRLCPYSCSFCVSGKNLGKLRGFPIEQVKEELNFISRIFQDRPQMEMHINDENFGILSRDTEIAEHIIHCRDTFGFPENVFFYHDKRFTNTTRHVLKLLAPMSKYGVTIQLQTENPEAIKVAKRQNITEEVISSVVEWASDNNLRTATELIFGLPGETVESFSTSLNNAITRGFDSVLCNTLFIVDGIEMNRKKERERLQLDTRFRRVRENYGMVEDQFCVEVEEVVVAARSFNQTGFIDIRKISMMFYACFNMRFQYWCISHFRHLGVSITSLMRELMDPQAVEHGPQRTFAQDFEAATTGELFADPQVLQEKLREEYIANGNDVGDASQLNIFFGARLIYNEGSWKDEALLTAAKNQLGCMDPNDLDITLFLMELYRRERFSLESLEIPPSLETYLDVLAWREDKFLRPLSAYRLEKPRKIGFSMEPKVKNKLYLFRQIFSGKSQIDYYCNILQNIGPRSDLLLDMEYI